MSKTKEIISLLDKGFIPYDGDIPVSFYEGKRCRHPQKAEWFCKSANHENNSSRYVCLGCRKRCSVVNPEGWALMLPMPKSRPSKIAFAMHYPLSVDEMLRLKRVLRPEEAAFCLNIGVTSIYYMVDEGKLDVVPGAPMRVTSESVARNLIPVTE